MVTSVTVMSFALVNGLQPSDIWDAVTSSGWAMGDQHFDPGPEKSKYKLKIKRTTGKPMHWGPIKMGELSFCKRGGVGVLQAEIAASP